MSQTGNDLPLYEKLGAFYLGRAVDPSSGGLATTPLLYDSRDLVTHAVIVGMTGSGKTGLGVALLEEAAIDGVPALIIDPKGDLTNLALTFPELRPDDFRPWLEAREVEEAAASGEDPAAKRAEGWRRGLASWDQGPERIARLRKAAEVAIYTPGSSAGRPISILGSLSAPPPAIREDDDLLGERVATWAASLLGLLGIDADPLTSREHILLSRILGDRWRAGQSLDLAGLVQQIQEPGFARLGVMDLETFFPSRERFDLALRLNNLLAAPAMASWLAGAPLDIGSLLWTESGRPRLAVLSIAHLSEAERMFFVSLLLDEVVGWARSQSGTTSLRAILYMDEVYGFLPPVAAPPSKRPFLTLLKQARAYGLGVVLATQNPVDLDYKALSNAGTWFLGRLQTERDRSRVLDGLEGTSAGSLDRRSAEEILGGLGKRRFLLHNVHEPAPLVFETRWVMSYLAGPLTRAQIKTLPEATTGPAEQAPDPVPAQPATIPASATAATTSTPARRPMLQPEVPVTFVAERRATAGELLYSPAILGSGTVHFVDARRNIEHSQPVALLAHSDSEQVDWATAAELVAETSGELPAEAETVVVWEAVPSAMAREASYSAWKRELSEHLYRQRRLELLTAPALEIVASPGEDERAFRSRLAQQAHEAADRAKDELRERHGESVDRLSERLRKAEQRVDRERDQAQRARFDTLASVGASALGALFGRRSSGLRTTLRGVGRSVDQQRDVGRAEEDVAEIRRQLVELEEELRRELETLTAQHDPRTIPLETIQVAPRRQDVVVDRVVLAWVPRRRSADGRLVDTWL